MAPGQRGYEGTAVRDGVKSCLAGAVINKFVIVHRYPSHEGRQKSVLYYCSANSKKGRPLPFMWCVAVHA